MYTEIKMHSPELDTLTADSSGQIRMAPRRNVKNSEKLKKRSFFPIKTLVGDLAPIRMMHKNTKKTLK